MKIEHLQTKLSCNIENLVYFDKLFGKVISKTDFISQIIFELIKENYHNTSKKYSLHAYALNKAENNYDNFNAIYERIKRDRKCAEKEQEKIYMQLNLGPYSCNNYNSDKNMYSYNNIELMQIDNYSSLEIVKALNEKRMSKSKKICRERFRDIFSAYDQYVVNQKNIMTSDELTLKNSIDFYDLQVRMKIELIYNLTLAMKKFNLTEFPQSRAFYFINGFYCKSPMIALQNRFLLQYNTWVPYIFNENLNNEYNTYRDSLFQLLLLKKELTNLLKKEYSSLDLNINDMAQFILKEYNPFSIFNSNKTWDDSSIDLARKVIKGLYG